MKYSEVADDWETCKAAFDHISMHEALSKGW
jgi:hypothetical protein